MSIFRTLLFCLSLSMCTGTNAFATLSESSANILLTQHLNGALVGDGTIDPIVFKRMFFVPCLKLNYYEYRISHEEYETIIAHIKQHGLENVDESKFYRFSNYYVATSRKTEAKILLIKVRGQLYFLNHGLAGLRDSYGPFGKFSSIFVDTEKFGSEFLMQRISSKNGRLSLSVESKTLTLTDDEPKIENGFARLMKSIKKSCVSLLLGSDH